MALPEWHIAVKLAEQPLAPKSILRLPETELGESPLGGCSISHLKQLIAGKLQESLPDPELIGACPAEPGTVPPLGDTLGPSSHRLLLLLLGGLGVPSLFPWGHGAPAAAVPLVGSICASHRLCVLVRCLMGTETTRDRSALTQELTLPPPLGQLHDFPPDWQLHNFPVLFPSQLEQLQLLNNPWGSKPHLETPSLWHMFIFRCLSPQT